MKRWIIAILAILALLLTGLILFYSTLGQKPVRTANKATTEQFKASSVQLNADTIFDLVNQERIKAGVKPLVRDDRLDATAQERADDMVARNYFSHNDPVTGENMVNILNGQNQCKDASENLSVMYNDAGDNNQDTIDGWMNSKPHHDAILNAEYDIAGIAVSGTKVVQHFCNLK